MTDVDESALKKLLYKQIFLGTIISSTLYFICVSLIFGLQEAIYLTVIITCISATKLPLFWRVVKRVRDEDDISTLIYHLYIDAAIIIIPTIVGLYVYFKAPITNTVLFSVILLIVLAKSLYSSLAVIIYMIKTGKVYDPGFDDNPVFMVSVQLSTLNFLLIPLYAGLCWWLIEDISVAVLTALLMYCVQYLAIEQRAKWICTDQQRKHNLLHHLVTTIALGVAAVMLKLHNPDVIYDNILIVGALSGLYYLANLNDIKFFNKLEESEE